MELTYYGANCLYITTKDLKILVDPLTGEYGPDPKLKADVSLYSQPSGKQAETKTDFVIDMPGEYEIKGVNIEGVAVRLHTESEKERKEGVMFTIAHKDVKALVCGNIDPNLSDEQIEKVDGVDVLVVPVGGKGLTLDKEAAASFVRQFSPGYAVPVHYDDGVTEYPSPQEGVDGFLQEVGASDAQRLDSLKISGRDMSEDSKFVVLNPQQKSK